jgi:hypothetical protein
MTLAIQSPAVFNNTALPLFPFESVPGTVLHIEPARSASLVSLSSGTTIPDLAGNIAGVGATIRSENYATAVGKLERTTKGGIHAAIKPGTSTYGYFEINPNLAVYQYILDNIDHEFFFSVWGYVTRAGTVSGEGIFSLSFSANVGTSDCLALFLTSGTSAPTPPKLKGVQSSVTGNLNLGAPQPFRVNMGVQGYTGTITRTAESAVTKADSIFLGAGAHGNLGTGGTAAGGASKIIYRAFIEDVTVSGRGFEELAALDNAFYIKEVLTSGGRYFGDTFTDPATL